MSTAPAPGKMRISMLPIVQRTVRVLDEIESAIAAVELGQVHVVIAGKYQDEAYVAACKATMLIELKGRKASLRRDLESYGVIVE